MSPKFSCNTKSAFISKEVAERLIMTKRSPQKYCIKLAAG